MCSKYVSIIEKHYEYIIQHTHKAELIYLNIFRHETVNNYHCIGMRI